MKAKAESHGAQFWDTSALVSLLFKERHSDSAGKAMEAGGLYMAWEWIQLEAYSALSRRGASPSEFKSLASLLSLFQFLSVDAGDYPDIQAILQKHRLRTADAGHLHCLKKARKVRPDLTFICFDEELVRAAGAEKIKLYS